jgi:hypothetical protein
MDTETTASDAVPGRRRLRLVPRLGQHVFAEISRQVGRPAGRPSSASPVRAMHATSSSSLMAMLMLGPDLLLDH